MFCLDAANNLLGYPRTFLMREVYEANYGHPVIDLTLIVRIVPGDLAVGETRISKIVGRVLYAGARPG